MAKFINYKELSVNSSNIEWAEKQLITLSKKLDKTTNADEYWYTQSDIDFLQQAIAEYHLDPANADRYLAPEIEDIADIVAEGMLTFEEMYE